MRGRGPWEVKIGWRGCREVLGSDQTGDSLGNNGVELSEYSAPPARFAQAVNAESGMPAAD